MGGDTEVRKRTCNPGGGKENSRKSLIGCRLLERRREEEEGKKMEGEDKKISA